jgi:hypothetical protein
MGQEDWELLLQGAQDVQYRKGDVIVKEGEKHLRIYQLTSGSVDIIKNTPEGPKKLVTLFPKRAPEIVVFGELTFLDPANQRVFLFISYFLIPLFKDVLRFVVSSLFLCINSNTKLVNSRQIEGHP